TVERQSERNRSLQICPASLDFGDSAACHPGAGLEFSATLARCGPRGPWIIGRACLTLSAVRWMEVEYMQLSRTVRTLSSPIPKTVPHKPRNESRAVADTAVRALAVICSNDGRSGRSPDSLESGVSTDAP